MKLIIFSVKVLILILVSGIIADFQAYSQEVSVRAKNDTNNVLIGDQINIKLELRSAKPLNITWPAIPDTIGRLELIKRSKIDTLDSNGTWTLRQNIVVTSFDSGYYEVPPFTFMYEKQGMESLYPVSTESILLKFNTVAIDTTKPIKDIKPQLSAPFDWKEMFVYLLIFVAIVLAGVVIYYILKRRKPKVSAPEKYDPKIPPHVIAIEALKRLDNEKLWQKGQVKLYQTKLTDILRTYIERRFNILALEMISREIVDAIGQLNIPPEIIEKMKFTLDTADLVKFAKYEPLPDENSLGMKNALEYVNATIPIEGISQNKGQGE
jgi:hypothetical protein